MDSYHSTGRCSQMFHSTYSKLTGLILSPSGSPVLVSRKRGGYLAKWFPGATVCRAEASPWAEGKPVPPSPLRPPWCGLSLHGGHSHPHLSSESGGTAHLSFSSETQRLPRSRSFIPLQPPSPHSSPVLKPLQDLTGQLSYKGKKIRVNNYVSKRGGIQCS